MFSLGILEFRQFFVGYWNWSFPWRIFFFFQERKRGPPSIKRIWIIKTLHRGKFLWIRYLWQWLFHWLNVTIEARTSIIFPDVQLKFQKELIIFFISQSRNYNFTWIFLLIFMVRRQKIKYFQLYKLTLNAF